jgi:aspartyl-tRNA(Asn)/glutamyl-tRNA(Gln) amidotransferase subunit C
MKVTEKDVAYVAGLANLELDAAERAAIVRDLNSILGYVERLNELDTSNIEPMAQVSDRVRAGQSNSVDGTSANALREDVIEGLRKSLAQEVALQNAPGSDGIFFRVPKVIER